MSHEIPARSPSKTVHRWPYAGAHRRGLRARGVACLLLQAFASAALATDERASLAREDQNPLTRYYVFRVEENAQFGFGPHGDTINALRLQPLLPLSFGEDWRLLVRGIVPMLHQPWPETANGLSDVGLNLFATPARSGSFSWGIGAGFLLPTATDDRLGTEKWSAGPSAAAVYIEGPWVVGAVVQNLWSYAGSDARREVDTMSLRPLVNYNLSNGWYLTTSPSIVANWEADSPNRWLVPVGGGVGKVFLLGTQRVSATFESYYHVKSPTLGPDWQVRAQFSLLYAD